jgi:glutamate-1-semialdehyde 2,1-aminomutase
MEHINIDKCLSMQDRASRRIPGMTQLLSKRPDQFSMGVWPGYYKKAKGAEVWDLDDNHYIDMSISGIGANVLGYADPDVDTAVINSIQNGSSCSLNCPEEVELADLLCNIHPWAEKVKYARSGGESMAIAVRIARAFTGRNKIAFCGYHGWHDWYLSANITTSENLDGHLLSSLNPVGVPRQLAGTAIPFSYNHLDELHKIITEQGNDLAAVIMEPIRSIQPEKGFLQQVKKMAEKNNSVLIFDEISAAFRMNSGGAHLHFGIHPDIAVFSKALGNGYPIGAIIGKSSVMDAAQNSFISSTCWTERTGPTAAIACINKFQEKNVAENLIKCGKKVQQGWKTISRKHDLAIKIDGIPPLSHFTFNENHNVLKALFIQLMLEKGFLASNIYYAMYAHTDDHITNYLEAVDEVFTTLINLNKSGDVESSLKGKPAKAGFKRLT